LKTWYKKKKRCLRTSFRNKRNNFYWWYEYAKKI